jgi:hypothetical protein
MQIDGMEASTAALTFAQIAHFKGDSAPRLVAHNCYPDHLATPAYSMHLPLTGLRRRVQVAAFGRASCIADRLDWVE